MDHLPYHYDVALDYGLLSFMHLGFIGLCPRVLVRYCLVCEIGLVNILLLFGT